MTNNNDWKRQFRFLHEALTRKTDYGGKKLPPSQFGYETEVDWKAVEDFISQNFIPLSSLEKFIEENEVEKLAKSLGIHLEEPSK